MSERRLAQAIPSNGLVRPRSLAEVAAVVETVIVEDTAGPPACGLNVAGENVQFSPVVSPVQERLIDP